MAILEVDFLSHSLKRNVTFRAIIPIESGEKPQKKLKTMYLLHGFYGNCNDWITNSNICAYAEKYGIAVIMPSGDNSCYLDNLNTGDLYAELIGKELVELTRNLFPLSEKQEDTIIAGLSMGGFGAIRNGLFYHDTFGSIIALSSALIIDQIINMKEDHKDEKANYDYYKCVFGEPSEFKNSDKNPVVLAKKMTLDKTRFPQIYMSCGTEDFLINENRKFVKDLNDLGISFTYVEKPGVHDWDFWNEHIKLGFEWFEQNKKQ